MRVASAIVCLALAALPMPAQQSRRMTETVEVRLIEIDAVVTDRRGNPISGLGPDDFELFENGRRQPITNLAEYRESEVVIPADPDAAVRKPAAPPQRRTILILIDALPLRGGERRRLFADVHSIVDRIMRDGDRSQVITWHDRFGMRALTPLTTSRAEIISALTTAENTLYAEPEDSTPQEIEWYRELAAESASDPLRERPIDGERQVDATLRQNAAIEVGLMRRKTAAFQRALAAVADPAGRSVAVYLSGAFPMIAGKRYFHGSGTRISATEEADYNTRPMLDTITRTANALGVVVYALHPQVTTPSAALRLAPSAMTLSVDDSTAVLESADPSSRSFPQQRPGFGLADASRDDTLLRNNVEALAVLAADTGGTVAVGRAAIRQAAERIARDLGSYYSLAYRATSDGSDRERRIEVRSRNRHHVVRARRTILDRSDATRARDLLVARLFEGGAAGDIEFDARVGAARAVESNRLLVPVELIIPLEQLRFTREGDELAAKFSVLAVAGENIGQLTQVRDESRRLVATGGIQPKGVVRHRFELRATARPTNVSIAVFDEISGLAGIQTIVIQPGQPATGSEAADSAADAVWREALLRAHHERNPILAYFRPARCGACDRFERESLAHPAIQRRLSAVVFVSVPATAGRLSRRWNSREPGLGVFDRLDKFRLRWNGIPDTGTLAAILDDIVDVAPHLERAAAAAEKGEPQSSELDAGIAFARLGRDADARAAFEAAIAGGSAETRQNGRIGRALLDANDGRARKALDDLDRIIAEAITPQIAGEAWLIASLIYSRAGAHEDAARAVANARELIDGEPRIAVASEQALAALRTAPSTGSGAIRIVPPDHQVATGRVTIKTIVDSADVAAVSFELDGVRIGRVTRPPFAATIDLGRVPEQREIGVVAFDDLGRKVGRDALTVNEGGERFWFRLIEPREGTAGGRTRVSMALRAPATQEVERVLLSWNGTTRAVVTAPPWEATVDIPAGRMGILRGLAQLADGRTAEDAVLLNAMGQVEHADVQLVELPVTLRGSRASEPPSLTTSEILVREDGRRRTIDSIQSGAEASLTVGLVIDTSGSMLRSLPDVQEAAIGFLEAVLTEGDRAFIVAFDTRAMLVQPPTPDVAVLRQKIAGLRARGLTALYDAIAVGLLQLEGVKGRRALIVFTDGVDRTSRYRAADVGDLAKRTHVPIHLIGAVPENPGLDRNWGSMYEALSRVARSTAGNAYKLERLDDLPRVYDRIEAALRSQFLLYVRTEPGASGNEWRRIDVAVDARGFTVHAPEGYYAPW
ncbi:MAG TPA: VWA domain-containing protein [Thermoanaerobaculia bacterium]|nr:VWA domain-containing protein [Thermoanaerobaculia bacterium]